MYHVRWNYDFLIVFGDQMWFKEMHISVKLTRHGLVMGNFIRQLDRDTGYLDTWLNIISECVCQIVSGRD